MELSYTEKKRVRRNFGKIKSILPIPDLIETQKVSFDQFLQKDVSAKDRKQKGIQSILSSLFPLGDDAGRMLLEFIKYEIEDPKNDETECHTQELTYEGTIRLTLRLTLYDLDAETGNRSVRDIREQEVYLGNIPLMTRKGTFIINGTDRAVVSQVHRSPGVFFEFDKGRSSTDKKIFMARLIPYRGAWLDFEFDSNDLIHVRIDRRRKQLVSTLLMALPWTEDKAGLTKKEILEKFYPVLSVKIVKEGFVLPFNAERYPEKTILPYDLRDAKTKEVLLTSGTRITKNKIEKITTKEILLLEEELLGAYVADPLYSDKKGEDLLIDVSQPLSEDIFKKIHKADLKKLTIFDTALFGPWLCKTFAAEKNITHEDALIDIYRGMRPGEPITPESVRKNFSRTFFSEDFYNLSAVGRMKLNTRLGISMDEVPDTYVVLRSEDIYLLVQTLLKLRGGNEKTDDIDHMGNRRVRPVGEMLETQYRIGVQRLERIVKDRMTNAQGQIEKVMPNDLINARPAEVPLYEFFSSSQLAQFVDQTNPLSEITHKRRLSALGPGGLSREAAGFEVRDVHPTHYGRICPIETPEGPNIGLINSLATYASINRYGFIEVPYRKVEGGKLKDDVRYMDAIEESKYTITQANTEVDKNNVIQGALVPARRAGETVMVRPEEIDYMDVSPSQLISVAAALIPFLENDDANRALMGSNMQRQALPLLRTEAPFVGTGMERIVARDSGALIVAKRGGTVQQADAMRIVIKADSSAIDLQESGVDIYRLEKFTRSNQSTCVNQKPLVKEGDRVREGDVIADGTSTDMGELALGRNVLVAFMPWNGYNFEDSILISERLVRDDVFTSIHIEEFEIIARDTKLGEEEITRDIPNVGEDALRHLDETGIAYIGAEVKAGDILVGKVTPKGESPITSEEKLLRAIFGEKASEFKDTSLRLPPGTQGTVVDTHIFNRRGLDKDERSISIEQEQIRRLRKDYDDEMQILRNDLKDRLIHLLKEQTLATSETVKTKTAARKGAKASLEKGAVLTPAILKSFSLHQLQSLTIEDNKTQDQLGNLLEQYEITMKNLEDRFQTKTRKIQQGSDLMPGVIKQVKVFVAIKQRLQPGDKMAGRHGNKGVVSRILPIEDLPFLEDGTPVDVVLSPLGVPSRMNIGQILETHLGWAARGLGLQIQKALDVARKGAIQPLRDQIHTIYEGTEEGEAIDRLNDDEIKEIAQNLRRGVPVTSPVFDGVPESDISDLLEKAGLDRSGQVTLFDGRTGDPFERQVTVGYMYMLKLNHLVDNKMHARSVGPYSLVTQQPLGGKAQFGGQRFGEMEVWALESYGAAYALQEILTVKSDDVRGRAKVYESIIQGQNSFQCGVPESFNVLLRELNALGLNIERLRTEARPPQE